MSGHSPDSFYAQAMKRTDHLERENERLRAALKRATKRNAWCYIDEEHLNAQYEEAES